jgi:1-acyl-sn-glycerol-3-phosphate acyltransferase
MESPGTAARRLRLKTKTMPDWNLNPAIAVPLALLALAVIAFLVYWLRSNYTFIQAILYLVNHVYTRVMWRARVSGRLPVAPGRGAVIVANHRSPVDPLFIQIATDRVVHWMVAKEYVEHGIVGWGLRQLQVIPVTRAGIDTAATRAAIRLAREGELIGMLPEGRINNTDKLLLPGRPGAALVALYARVPVIPCYIEGAPYDGTTLGCLRMRARVRVKIGQPMDISEFYGREREQGVAEELTRRFLRAIAQLAGVDDFEPELAGRRWKPGLDDENGNGNRANGRGHRNGADNDEPSDAGRNPGEPRCAANHGSGRADAADKAGESAAGSAEGASNG